MDLEPEPLDPNSTRQVGQLYAKLKEPEETELERLEQSFPSRQADDNFVLAVGSVDGALKETRKYLRYLREDGKRQRKTEDRLSNLWSAASLKMMRYDSDLAILCMIKGHGWADPSVWNDPQYRDEPTGLEEMYDRLKILSKHHSSQKFELYLAFAFGLTGLIVILVLAMIFPEPKPFQYTVFRIVLALAAAGIAAIIPGFLNVQFRTLVRAGGAIGVFVIVYFFSPAELVVQQPPTRPTATPASTPSPSLPSPTLPKSSSLAPKRQTEQRKPKIIQESVERPSPETRR